MDDWFASMPYVKAWIDSKRKEAMRGERQQTIFGRVRHYVLTDENAYHIQNNYVNTPIQSIASDLTLFSLLEIYDWMVANGLYCPWNPEGSKARIVATVHDSIVLEVVDEYDLICTVADKGQALMRDVPAAMLPDCEIPFKADCEVGETWGGLKEEWRL